MDQNQHISPRQWAILATLSGAIFLEGIDVAMINMALPAIRQELGLDTKTLAAVISAYVLGYAGFMLLGGRTADVFGKRRVFIVALAFFIVFSIVGGLAVNGPMLLASRFLTGVAAAFMTPAGLSLVTTNFAEGPQRSRAILIYAGTASAGFSFGLVAGGLLSMLSWRWVFFGPVIMASALLLVAPLIISRSSSKATGQSMDLPGAIFLTGAMLATVLAVTQIENLSQAFAPFFVSVGVGAGLLALFFHRQVTSRFPLIDISIFKSGPLVRANACAALFAGSFFGFTFLVTLYLQEALAWTPLQAGMVLLLVSIDAVLAPTLTPWLVERFGNMGVILAGLLLALLAYVLFLPINPSWTYLNMMPTMVVLGLGFALAYGPLTILATAGVPSEQQGVASGVINTSFQFGAALGLAAAAATAHVLEGSGLEVRIGAIQRAFFVPVLGLVIAVAILAAGMKSRKS